MKLEISEKKDTSMQFVVKNINVSFVNALRRTLLTDISKMAIDTVEFHLGTLTDEKGKDYESIAPLFDEVIAHRLSMVPIPTDLKMFASKDKCDCKGTGCPSCELIYTVKKFGPCTVYSGDLQPSVGGEKFRIKEDKIPIVKLTDGQGLFITATAVLGTAKEHAKWQTTSGVGYKYYPIIKIDTKKCNKCGECSKICPRDVIKAVGKKITIEDIERCNLCRSCEEVCKQNAVKLEHDDARFIFKFETDGAITAEEALNQALQILKSKCNELTRKIK